MSGGGIWIPNNHHMKRLGAEDTREKALTYIRAASPEGWQQTEDSLWTAFVDHGPEMIRFVEKHSPTRFNPNREPDPYAEAPGGMAYGRNVSAAPIRTGILGAWRNKIRIPAKTFPLNYEEVFDTFFFANPKKQLLRMAPRIIWRLLTKTRTMGRALCIGLLKGCLDNGVEIWLDSSATQLTKDDQAGRITGLKVERNGQEITVIADKAVILATGGFEWNKDMMAENFPGPVELTASPKTNTGDGHRMAQEVGAQLVHMDQALVMGVEPVEYEGQIQGAPSYDYSLPHSMIINRHGHRFVNEKQMNIGLAFEELDPETRTPAHLPAWRIYDSQFAKKYPLAMPKKSFPGNYFKANSLNELAIMIGVDGASLETTAKGFSDAARIGVDHEFERGANIWDTKRGCDPTNKPNPTLGTIEQAPFYAMPFRASFFGTKGGPRTNEHAQVLDQKGEVIAGLYAAGNVMANPIGSKGIGAGTTLGPCLTFGYIAARSALNIEQDS